MNRSTRIRAFVVLLAMFGGLLAVAAPNANADGNHNRIELRAPFSGRVTSAPGAHWRPYGGDWSMDQAASAGTVVRARFGQATSSATYRVVVVKPACATGVISHGGYQVKVEVSVGGAPVGWVIYSHIQPYVSVGQTIGNAQPIGHIGNYGGNSGCWTGPHVHIEPFNYKHWSCSIGRAAGTYLSDGTVLGIMGGSSGSVANRRCTSTDLSFAPVDTTAPTITATVSPRPNTFGWNSQPVRVTFSCNDAGGISSCTSPVTLTSETSGQPVAGTAIDRAGNRRSVTVWVRIDRTAPTMSAAATTAPNENGWYNSGVRMDWTCADNLSGLLSSCNDTVIDTEGVNSYDIGVSIDRAGNGTTAASPSVSIDKTAPSVDWELDRPANDAGWHNAPVDATVSCADDLSGLVAECPESVSFIVDGAAQAEEVTATDLADNATTVVVGEVNIDSIAPQVAVSPTVVSSGTVSGTASDELSGLATVVVEIVSLIDGSTLLVDAAVTDGVWVISTAGATRGPSTITASATDVADNGAQSAPQLTVVA